MNEELLKHLNNYCGAILGEQEKKTGKQPVIKINKPQIKIKKPQIRIEETIKNKEPKVENKEPIIEAEKKTYTDDGFKICLESLLPDDDSDIDDAFDIEENSSSDEVKNLSNKLPVPSITDNYKNIKKPLFKFIKHFGLEDKFLKNGTEDKSEKNVQNDGQTNIKMFDYSHRTHKKRKISPEGESTNKKTTKFTSEQAQKNAIEFKKMRYEVYKFGVSGFEKKNKESLKIQMAVQLGAKPPKNAYKNYKELLKEKKLKQQQEKEDQEHNREEKMFKPKAKKEERKRGPAPHLDPLTGSFKRGMLKLSKNDFKKLQGR